MVADADAERSRNEFLVTNSSKGKRAVKEETLLFSFWRPKAWPETGPAHTPSRWVTTTRDAAWFGGALFRPSKQEAGQSLAIKGFGKSAQPKPLAKLEMRNKRALGKNREGYQEDE